MLRDAVYSQVSSIIRIRRLLFTYWESPCPDATHWILAATNGKVHLIRIGNCLPTQTTAGLLPPTMQGASPSAAPSRAFRDGAGKFAVILVHCVKDGHARGMGSYSL